MAVVNSIKEKFKADGGLDGTLEISETEEEISWGS